MDDKTPEGIAALLKECGSVNEYTGAVVFQSHESLQAFIAALTAQPVQSATGCACKWNGELSESRCELHEAWHVAILEWSDRAKAAEAKLAQLVQPAPYQVTDGDAFKLLADLARALDSSHISSWQTTAGWSKELAAALDYVEARKASA